MITNMELIISLESRIKSAQKSLPFAERNYAQEAKRISDMKIELAKLRKDTYGE